MLSCWKHFKSDWTIQSSCPLLANSARFHTYYTVLNGTYLSNLILSSNYLLEGLHILVILLLKCKKQENYKNICDLVFWLKFPVHFSRSQIFHWVNDPIFLNTKMIEMRWLVSSWESETSKVSFIWGDTVIMFYAKSVVNYNCKTNTLFKCYTKECFKKPT